MKRLDKSAMSRGGRTTAHVADHLSVVELEQRYRTCTDACSARHYQTIWLLAQGHTIEEAAETTCFVPRWIEENWPATTRLVRTRCVIFIAIMVHRLRREPFWHPLGNDFFVLQAQFPTNCRHAVGTEFANGCHLRVHRHFLETFGERIEEARTARYLKSSRISDSYTIVSDLQHSATFDRGHFPFPERWFYYGLS
jgi:hypothetical protein